MGKDSQRLLKLRFRKIDRTKSEDSSSNSTNKRHTHRMDINSGFKSELMAEDSDAPIVWEPIQSPGFLLWSLENLWQREQRRVLEPFGITTVQFLLLSGLVHTKNRPNNVSQSELSTKCRADPMMTSQVVRTLVRIGLVTRKRNKTDQRAFTICVTEKGHSLHLEADNAVRKTEENFFSVLGPNISAFSDALKLLSGERPRRRIQAVSRFT